MPELQVNITGTTGEYSDETTNVFGSMDGGLADDRRVRVLAQLVNGGCSKERKTANVSCNQDDFPWNNTAHGIWENAVCMLSGN